MKCMFVWFLLGVSTAVCKSQERNLIKSHAAIYPAHRYFLRRSEGEENEVQDDDSAPEVDSTEVYDPEEEFSARKGESTGILENFMSKGIFGTLTGLFQSREWSEIGKLLLNTITKLISMVSPRLATIIEKSFTYVIKVVKIIWNTKRDLWNKIFGGLKKKPLFSKLSTIMTPFKSVSKLIMGGVRTVLYTLLKAVNSLLDNTNTNTDRSVSSSEESVSKEENIIRKAKTET